MAAYLAFPTSNSTIDPEFDPGRSIRSTYYFYPNGGPFVPPKWIDIPDIHFIPPGFNYWHRRRPDLEVVRRLLPTISTQGKPG